MPLLTSLACPSLFAFRAQALMASTRSTSSRSPSRAPHSQTYIAFPSKIFLFPSHFLFCVCTSTAQVHTSMHMSCTHVVLEVLRRCILPYMYMYIYIYIERYKHCTRCHVLTVLRKNIVPVVLVFPGLFKLIKSY